MENFDKIASIKDTNEKLDKIHETLSELDNKYDKQSRELTKQVWELEDIINSIDWNDKVQYSKEIEAIKKEMSELEENWDIYSTEDYDDVKESKNIESTKENLSEVTLDWIDYKVWDNYTMRWLRQFWLFWKKVVLEWIYKFTNEDWTDWYKWVSSTNGVDYDLTFFKEAKENNDTWNAELINKLKKWDYTAEEIFTTNEWLFNYMYSYFQNASIITDEVVSIFKDKIVDYAKGFDITLKTNFKVGVRKIDGLNWFVVEEKYIKSSAMGSADIELTFGE